MAVKGFHAREPIKGNMVSAVKGLKLYEEIFSGLELIKLSEFEVIFILQATKENFPVWKSLIYYRIFLKSVDSFGYTLYCHCKSGKNHGPYGQNLRPRLACHF